MGILDGIVEWIAEQVMYGLDLINTSVLGALGCDMTTFLRYFPAAETMYNIFVALAIGMILLNLIWQLFKNYGLIAGVEAEDPVKLTIRSVLFILLAYFADEIVELILKIGGTPYAWIMSSELPALNFADFNSVILTILGVCANGAVALIALILVLILAWNYIKLLFEAAALCAAGRSGIHGTGGFCYGRGAEHLQHLQGVVPDVRWPDISAADERMVPAPVHHHGGNLPGKPLIPIGDDHESKNEIHHRDRVVRTGYMCAHDPGLCSDGIRCAVSGLSLR